MASLRLTGPAASDIAELLEWTEETFGTPARRRYEALIATALKVIAQDWQRAGSVRRDDLRTGCRAFHLRHSRSRAKVGGGVVESPRHILVYRLTPGDILRVLHDIDGPPAPSGRATIITRRITPYSARQETPCASRSSVRETKSSPARSSTPTSAT